MGDSCIAQRIIASEHFIHGDSERLSFVVIAGTNERGDYTDRTVQACLLFHCRQHEES